MTTQTSDDGKFDGIELELSDSTARSEIIDIAKSTYQRLFLEEIDALMLELDRHETEILEFLKTHRIR